jgi:hypothetical protein
MVSRSGDLLAPLPAMRRSLHGSPKPISTEFGVPSPSRLGPASPEAANRILRNVWPTSGLNSASVAARLLKIK